MKKKIYEKKAGDTLISMVLAVILITISFSTIGIADSVGPSITNIDKNPDVQRINGYVNITCNVVDPDDIDKVYLHITDPNSNIQNFSITANNTGNTYYCNKTYDIAGQYHFFIWAKDTKGQSTRSSIYTFSIIRWNVLLNVTATNGKYDTAIFGEVDGASDGKDIYDIPKPPSPGHPYVDAWFNAGLTSPYDKLWADYRDYPGTGKVWDLYIKCNTTLPGAGDTTLTITWDKDEINATEYDHHIQLWNTTKLVADMKSVNHYSFEADFDVVYHFQIKCDVNDPPVVSGIPDQTIAEGSTFTTINLDDYVTDVDNTDAQMTWTYSGNSSLTVTIDASRKANITIPSVDWNGAETITFKATDPGALYDNDSATFTVTPVNDPPVADFTYTPLLPSTIDLISFNSTSTDIDGTIVNWTWDFGDGNISYGEKVTHQYSADGSYTVNLTVKDNDNAIDSIEKIINVIAVNRIYLQKNWNLISLPFNESISKYDIMISYGGTNYTWNEAVTANIILNFIYGWKRGPTNQSYESTDTLQPGHGYWVWSYHSNVELLLSSDVSGDGHITALKQKWNIMGQPYNTTLDKNNLIIRYNVTDYTWTEATTNNNEEGEPLLLGFIYEWNRNNQQYILSDLLQPGYGYWMYAYYNITLYRPMP